MPAEKVTSRSPTTGKLIQYNDFIDAKIESTRRTVKLVDFATSVVALAAATLAFLLVAAVVEHWLVPGGFPVAVRSVLFALLVAGVGYIAFRRLWPLCVRAINPVYAAHTIEHNSPSLKNSLINLLLFRQRRADISDAVYRTLEEQAAQRLTRVPIETAVDRSQLIHLGYVLLAIVAVAGLYKVFSPKDPLVSAGRVLAPWADIVPASRVSITAIKPGQSTVSRGEFLDVSADVRGLGERDDVLLRYTTDDGQVVGRAVPMKPSPGGFQFNCRLSEDADGTQSVGLTRNLSYRLEAGDARSLDYAIRVVAAPSILVQRVEYDYPAYTGFVDRAVEGVGDLRAIEGTRVTIHARANGPIRDAHVDFDADGRRDTTMTIKNDDAHASFELGLRNDRQTPRHESYVLRFTNADGRSNRDPVKHSIHVERDYEPEAAITTPQPKAIEVRPDEKVSIEVEARDPDFALSAVRLHGKASGGRSVFDESLLNGQHRGRFSSRFELTPSAHGLKSGDVVEYWVEASDNRTPKPNLTASERKTLRIISPDPAQQPPPDRIARNDRQQGRQGEGERGRGGDSGAGNKGGNAGEKKPSAPGGQGEGKQDQQQQRSDDPQNKAGNQNEFSRDAQRSADKEQRQGDKETGRQGDSGATEQGDQKGEKPGTASKSSDPKSTDPQPNDKQTGAGAAGGASSKGDPQPDGARPDNGNGQEQAKPGDDQSPVSSEGDNDAEAFNRIQRHMEKSGDLKQEAEQRQGDKETRRQGDSAGESASADGTSGGEPKDPQQQQQPGKSNDPAKGPGAETRGDDPLKSKEQAGEPQDRSKSPGGQQTATKGPAGAGQEQKPQGAPNAKPDMKPAEKREQSGSKEEKTNDVEPPAADGQSKRESDSQGDQGGDKAGGGEEGGGQRAPREGTGSAGQNQSADEGAGESAEKGKGNTSPNAGRDAKSDGKSGASDGKTPGEGSQQRDGTGDKPGGGNTPPRDNEQPFSREAKPSAEQQARQGEGEKGRGGDKGAEKQGNKGASEQKNAQPQADKQPGNPQSENANSGKGDPNQNPSGGTADGGGGQQGAFNPAPSITGETPEGDAANLEYARKQTDLVLDKLGEQLSRKRVDDTLLKDLGWSEEQLRRFVARWQERKAAAGRDDPSADVAKRELDDALRSLGLRRGELQQNAARKDSLRDLREGYRGAVPPEYQERLRAYNEGVSRARQDGE